MKPLNECIYYLVSEMGGLGARAKDVYFEDALEGLREHGCPTLRAVEIHALIDAALRRGRLSELDEVMGYKQNQAGVE